MKILQVIQSLKIGGAERVCLDLSAELITRGHTVKIVLLQDRREIDLSEYECNFDIQALLPNEVPVYIRALHRLIPAFKRVYKEGWDVVHCHMDGALLVAGLSGGRPICYTVHNSEHGHWQGIGCHRLRAILEWLITRRSSVSIVGCGPGATSWATVHLQNQRHPVECISNGVNTKKYLFKTGPWSPSQPLQILMVGKLVQAKDYDTALRAINVLTLSATEASLDIVGAGNLQQQLEDLVDKLNIRPRVRFLGYRPDVQVLLRQYDLFWLTSKHEGLPLVLLEAIACGIPVIATDAPGIREVAQDLKIPLVPISDPNRLAHRAISMVNEPENVEVIRGYGRSEVEKNYSTSNMTDRYLEMFLQITHINITRSYEEI